MTDLGSRRLETKHMLFTPMLPCTSLLYTFQHNLHASNTRLSAISPCQFASALTILTVIGDPYAFGRTGRPASVLLVEQSFFRSSEYQDAVERSSGLRHRADPLADASDSVSEEVEQVWNRQECCGDPCKNSRCMMHAKILVHRYRHNHHATRYHVANQRDSHQRRCSVLCKSLDDVHVDRQKEGQETVPEDGASG